jgi:flagellar basal-body rod protein FlgF
MGTGGQFDFAASETDISISSDGSISSSAGVKGRLQIVEFADPQTVERLGNNLWTGGTPLPATSTTVIQGSIEKSNVSGVADMSDMVRVQRAYESIQALMQRQDDQRRTAIQKLGSLSA